MVKSRSYSPFRYAPWCFRDLLHRRPRPRREPDRLALLENALLDAPDLRDSVEAEFHPSKLELLNTPWKMDSSNRSSISYFKNCRVNL